MLPRPQVQAPPMMHPPPMVRPGVPPAPMGNVVPLVDLHHFCLNRPNAAGWNATSSSHGHEPTWCLPTTGQSRFLPDEVHGVVL